MQHAHKSEWIFLPRTAADFALIDLMVWAGYTDERILEFLKNQHWRSQVINLPGGNLACVQCRRLTEKTFCPECGQPDGGAFE